MISKIRIAVTTVLLVAGLLVVSAIPTIGHEENPETATSGAVIAYVTPTSTPRPTVKQPTTVPVVPVVNQAPAAAAPARVDPKFKPYPAYLYIPTDAAKRQPLQIVLALHGMGGEGKGFGGLMMKEAEKHGWLLVAPTIAYRDWRNPDSIAGEEIETTQRLIATIDQLPAQTGLSLKPLVHVYGFSRGAQLAHRFALFFPERVDDVAPLSAGTYTLPFRSKDVDGDGRPDSLPLPYGVSDLSQRLGRPYNVARVRQVDFLVGVGGADNAAGDVPRPWDPYIGTTRLERAGEFVKALQSEGVQCRLKVFPGAGHEVNQTMISEVAGFFDTSTAAAATQ